MEDFTNLMNMFGPTPGMDPFALGNTLATNPDAAVSTLATAGPPPAQGQGFTDWLQQKISGAGNAPGSVPPMPQPVMPPRASGQTFGGPGGPKEPAVTGPFSSDPTARSPLLGPEPNAYGNAAVPRVGGPFPPSPPSPNIPGAPPSMGPQFNEAFGSVPPSPGYTGVEQVPGVGPVPTTGTIPTPRPELPTGMDIAGDVPHTPPTYQRTTKPDILAADDERRRLATGESAAPPKPPVNVAEALKKAGAAFSGIKAPPAPATQHLSTPSLPRAAAGQTGGIEALIAAMLGRQAAAGAGASPLRLGNALYAGGKGLY